MCVWDAKKEKETACEHIKTDSWMCTVMLLKEMGTLFSQPSALQFAALARWDYFRHRWCAAAKFPLPSHASMVNALREGRLFVYYMAVKILLCQLRD